MQDDVMFEFVKKTPSILSNSSHWEPKAGKETGDLLARQNKLSADEKATVIAEAIDTLSKAVPPNGPPSTETGLVVGYVQSGKTLAFTTVAALARDNGYPLVILISGSSLLLSEQSRDRLLRDLDFKNRPRSERGWFHQHNPNPNDENKKLHKHFVSHLKDWKDVNVLPEQRLTVLITVMKQRTHLLNLNALLGKIAEEVDLSSVPALILDDEADQATQNAGASKGERSPMYSYMLGLRDKLPHQTLLQYTATPQANLLINVLDSLSPNFCDVLTPGKAYVGGQQFFTADSLYTKCIPSDQLSTKKVALQVAPPSLKEAMRLFFVGVAAGDIRRDSDNRSMMVHPSQATSPHTDYHDWVESIRRDWEEKIHLPKNDPDRLELVREFSKSYDDLKVTVNDIPDFKEISERLGGVIEALVPQKLNADKKDNRGRTPRVNWDVYAHLLVGGQSMDRGFTVEGLTVTYMPRSAGVGNADTIQQRARFFGYKKRELGYCRIYLQQSVEELYRLYVEHEENVRNSLIDFKSTGQPLKEWKRQFVLDQKFTPTRKSLLNLPGFKVKLSDKWWATRAPQESYDAIVANRNTFDEFIRGLNLLSDVGHPKRTEDQKHMVAWNIPVASILQDLLIPIRVTNTYDSVRSVGLMIQIKEYLKDHPDAVGCVYLMKGGRRRDRTAPAMDKPVGNLFQGPDDVPGISPKEMRYPGDRNLGPQDLLKVEMEYLDVTIEEETDGKMKIKTQVDKVENVPALKIWVPKAFAKGTYIQGNIADA